MSTIIFQAQSVLIVALYYFGISKKRHKQLHMKIMKTGIIWDLILVAQIELTRGAIAKASHATTNPTFLNIHVAIAISSVVFLLLMWFLGSKLAKGQETLRVLHKRFGFVTITLRTLTLITSFFVN